MSEAEEIPAAVNSNTFRATRRFDARVYRLEAVKRAAYRHSGQLDCLIRIEGSEICAELSPRTEVSVSEYERLIGAFCTEVLDQELREAVAAETEAIRNLIIAHAFSHTTLIDPELDACDYASDPLGIGIDGDMGEHPRKD